MPFYYNLRIRNRDSEKTRAYKKRVAVKLLELRKALHQHITKSTDAHDTEGAAGGEMRHVDDSAKLLRLATWNIREFDSEKYGKRLQESFYYIAEVLSNFDLIAVQEVREDRAALQEVMRILGPGWNYIATDVTAGIPGNRERMVFIFNTNKVWFRNIAGEVVLRKAKEIEYPFEERLRFDKELVLELPEGTRLEYTKEVETSRRQGKHRLEKEVEIDLPEGSKIQLPKDSKLVLPRRYNVQLTDDNRLILPEGTELSFVEEEKDEQVMVKLPQGAIVGESLQFARTPFLVAFQSGWLKLNLCTVHIYYGSDTEGLERRKEEIRRLTEFLAERASSEKDTDADSFFVALGDFNIVDKEHDTMEALKTNGFRVPDALKSLPGTNVDKSKAYDQIAYWDDSERVAASPSRVTMFEVHRAGVFDFFETVFREGDYDPEGQDEAHYTSLEAFKEDWDYRDWRTHQMSDHLPMWVELRIDFGDEYLENISKTG